MESFKSSNLQIFKSLKTSGRFCAFILLALLYIPIHAQVVTHPSLTVGVKGGATATDMVYTNPVYDVYAHQWNLDWLAGGYLKYRPVGWFALMLDVQYVGRGTHLSWADARYSMKVKGMDYRLLCAIHFNDKDFSPYVAFGPTLSVPLQGRIAYQSDYTPSFDKEVSGSTYRPLNFGAYVGLGFDYSFAVFAFHYRPITIGLEIGLFHGISNTFSKIECTDESVILNPEPSEPIYSGMRLPRGLEIAARIGIPIQKKSKGVKKLEDRWGEMAVDTIPSSVDEEKDEYVSGPYYVKECFPLSEVRDMVQRGEDITGIRICLFNIRFEFDKSELKTSSERILSDLAAIMRRYPEMTINVYGHTDSLGSDEYNQRLSESRAGSVASYISSFGVDRNRINAVGFGEKYPIETNASDWGRSRNRRVEIEVTHMGKKHEKSRITDGLDIEKY